MKKLKYIASLAGSLLISTSCVDLYQDPQSFISEEEYISNIDQESLEGAVSALYNNLWHDNYGFNSRIQRILPFHILFRIGACQNQVRFCLKEFFQAQILRHAKINCLFRKRQIKIIPGIIS